MDWVPELVARCSYLADNHILNDGQSAMDLRRATNYFLTAVMCHTYINLKIITKFSCILQLCFNYFQDFTGRVDQSGSEDHPHWYPSYTQLQNALKAVVAFEVEAVVPQIIRTKA